MGLFDRKSKAAPVHVPELPPTLSTADLARAGQLIDRWQASAGNSDAIWSCVDDFWRIGGFPGPEAVIRQAVDGKAVDDVLNRPWRWWAEATALAYAQGEYWLAARIFMFAYFIMVNVVPKADLALQMDTGITPPGQGTYQRIAASAAQALAELPQDQVVARAGADTVIAGVALLLAKSVAAPGPNA